MRVGAASIIQVNMRTAASKYRSPWPKVPMRTMLFTRCGWRMASS